MLVLLTLYPQKYIVVSPSSDKWTYCKSLWINALAKRPECERQTRMRSWRRWRQRGPWGGRTWGPSAGLLDGESLMGGPAVTAGLLGKYGRLCQSLEEGRRHERDDRLV